MRPSFDIASLVDFNSPTEGCRYCLALWPDGIGPTKQMTGLASSQHLVSLALSPVPN